MKLSRLNLLTAVILLIAALTWFVTGQNATGLIWLACSLIWLALAMASLRRPIDEPRPIARLVRRLSRMLIWS